MIGIDTSFLVAFEVSSHPLNSAAWELARRCAPETLALAPQVLSEFIHVTTDRRRFEHPLTVRRATERCLKWWNAAETRRLFPTGASVDLFSRWMQEFSLGRKRIRDAMLAAVYKSSGVSLILSSDTRDFAQFPGMHPLLLHQ